VHRVGRDHTAGMKLLRTTLGTAAGLLFILSLTGYLGGHHRLLEVTGAPRLFYLVAGGLLLAAGLILRQTGTVLPAALTVAVNLMEITPFYVGRRDIPETATARLEVLSYNLLGYGRRPEDMTNVLKDLKQENPDLLVLQESANAWPETLAVLKQTWPYHVRSDRMHLEIFSQLELHDVKEHRFGEIRGFIQCRLEIDGRPVEIHAHHAYPQFHYGERGFAWRNQQLLEGIGQQTFDDVPAIVLGDLNASPWSPTFKTMMKQSGLENARTGFGLLPSQGPVTSWGLPKLFSRPIDHCLVTPDVYVESIHTGSANGSDHMPVVCVLRF
ncbi:MAG: endonuclease/exonuclease/phosphatase family protein, partial [Verrucomicrobiota bacterium]